MNFVSETFVLEVISEFAVTDLIYEGPYFLLSSIMNRMVFSFHKNILFHRL